MVHLGIVNEVIEGVKRREKVVKGKEWSAEPPIRFRKNFMLISNLLTARVKLIPSSSKAGGKSYVIKIKMPRERNETSNVSGWSGESIRSLV